MNGENVITKELEYGFLGFVLKIKNNPYDIYWGHVMALNISAGEK